MKFTIHKKSKSGARVGVIETTHGKIATPAFVVVGTKGTVKALTPQNVAETGAEVVLGNTYHLYLEPGQEIVQKAGGLGKFMNWSGPTMTDSGGFQVFSLGAAFGKKISKVGFARKVPTAPVSNSQMSKFPDPYSDVLENIRIAGAETVQDKQAKLAEVDEDGVSFRSYLDGSRHRFTPEKSIEIQHAIGADIIFAFDECTSPEASFEYQREAMERTHRWAERSLNFHKSHATRYTPQSLFGIVQGGRFEDLRKESAKIIGAMDFDGFGIGGSFDKEDMGKAVRWVNETLPEEKPRHLLGIGEPLDLVEAIRNGCDLFDCVAPTRMARNGTLQTSDGRVNILNARFREDFSPIEEDCDCYTCKNFTRAYLAHLFRAEEMLAATLASIHNVRFMIRFVSKIRQEILDGNFT